jgi:Ulp1 family protease
MSRKEEKSTSNVHFFTSHFFTALKELGPEAVSNWTAKKEIDIFTKKLVFIPVNRAGHWSLCVVINPGEIGSMYPTESDDNVDDVELGEQKLPCILFLDSLNLHSPKMVSMNIHRWLNSEWKRLRKKQDGVPSENPFNPDSFGVRSLDGKC